MQIRINREHVIGIVCIGIGTLVMTLTRNFPTGQGYVKLTGPAFFPNVLSIILILAGVAEVVNGIILRTSLSPVAVLGIGEQLKTPGTQTLLIIIALMVLYVLFMKPVGFFPTSFLFLFLLMWRLKVRWWKSALFSIVLLGVLYGVFVRLFYVNLPAGLLG